MRLMVKLSCPVKNALADKTTTNSTASKETGKSRFSRTRSTFIGCSIAETPPTISRLNRLEPRTLPTAMPLCPVILPVTETAASGRLVPKAMTVRPIITGEIRKCPAMPLPPDTAKSAPLISRTKPMSNKI